MSSSTRCPYCGAKLAADGFCSKPCKAGDLARKVAEEEKKRETEPDKQ